MKKEFASVLENSKNYTLKVAAAMPETGYGFRPRPEGWTFHELMNHIAYGISWWEENYIKGKETPWNPPTAPEQKEVIIRHLHQAYDSLINTLYAADLNEEKMIGMFATLDHVTHHRGQAVLYLRLQGVTPPEYTF